MYSSYLVIFPPYRNHVQLTTHSLLHRYSLQKFISDIIIRHTSIKYLWDSNSFSCQHPFNSYHFKISWW